MFPGAASILNKEFAEELYRKMGEDFLVVFGAEGEIQIHEKDSDVEDLQIEREMQNAGSGCQRTGFQMRYSGIRKSMGLNWPAV